MISFTFLFQQHCERNEKHIETYKKADDHRWIICKK